MWIRIKDKLIYDTAWYNKHKGEIFEVYKTDTLSDDSNDYYYSIKSNNFYVYPDDVDIVEPRRLKINKIKDRCGLK